jgi:hypothetical protein
MLPFRFLKVLSLSNVPLAEGWADTVCEPSEAAKNILLPRLNVVSLTTSPTFSLSLSPHFSQ